MHTNAPKGKYHLNHMKRFVLRGDESYWKRVAQDNEAVHQELKALARDQRTINKMNHHRKAMGISLIPDPAGEHRLLEDNATAPADPGLCLFEEPDQEDDEKSPDYWRYRQVQL